MHSGFTIQGTLFAVETWRWEIEQEHPNQEPIEIRSVSISLPSEVRDDSILVAVRVVSEGRNGNIVFARTLRPDEEDDGTPVVINPSLGERRITFRPGSLQVSIRDVDRYAKVGPDGYAPITNTIWTWLSIGSPATPELFRYLLAAARRLDGTRALLVEVSSIVDDMSGSFVGIREQYFRALSIAEILTVALGRSVDLLDTLSQSFPETPPIPTTIYAKKESVQEIRNAFEHIEDRALGQVRRKPHQDALSVFDQGNFLSQGKLTYGAHSLDLYTEVPQILIAARQYIYDVAVSVGGPARYLNSPIEFSV